MARLEQTPEGGSGMNLGRLGSLGRFGCFRRLDGLGRLRGLRFVRCRGCDFSGRATPTRRRGRRVLLFGALTLLAFPASTDARHLVITERARRTTNGHVHLPKQTHHFVSGDAEFPRHVGHTLAQT